MNRLSEKVNAKTVLKVLANHKFKIFSNSDRNFNLNIVNIRSSNKKAGKFDDTQILFWFYKHQLNRMIFDVTVDPGIPYLLKPLNPKGAAIVKPGQYRNIWSLGKHKGKYDALIQVRNITVMRDSNKDSMINDHLDFWELGIFGINCHRASAYTIRERVGYYSAGCVVHKDPKQYDKFIKVCKEAAINWENSFTATWITERDYDRILTKND